MVAWASRFIRGFSAGAVAGGGLSVANSAAGSAFANPAIDPYVAAKERFAAHDYVAAALSAGHALSAMAGSIGAAVGSYMGTSAWMTAGATILLGTTTLPAATSVAIAIGATLLASGAASAVGTLISTGSLSQSAKAGVNGVVNPLPLVSIHLAGMDKAVEPPWFNILGIPEYMKANRSLPQPYSDARVPESPLSTTHKKVAPYYPLFDEKCHIDVSQTAGASAGTSAGLPARFINKRFDIGPLRPTAPRP